MAELNNELEPAPEPGPDALPQPVEGSNPSSDAVISAAIVPSSEPAGVEITTTPDPTPPLTEAGKASEPWRDEIQKLAKEFEAKIAELQTQLPATRKPPTPRQSRAAQRTIQIVAKEERVAAPPVTTRKRARTLSFWKR